MRPTLDRLRSASAPDVAAYLAQVVPEEFVGAVRNSTDAELVELVGRPEVRSVAVQGILARLHEYAVADRLVDIAGTLRVDLGGGGRLLERHGLVLDHGTLRVLPDLTADAPVDVVLHTSLPCFLRLVSGEGNAGLDYLSGALDIGGDAELALAIGGIFRVPGNDDVAVDPRALDPVDVATALGQVSPAHLRAVMSSGFRPVVLGEIFRRLPDFVNPKKAARAHLDVGFRLLGRADGGIDRYVVHVAAGVATVTTLDGSGPESGSDVDGGHRDATITCEAADFLRLATGHLSAVSGVLRGQLKVRGDKTKALQLSSLLDIPRAR